VSDKIKCSCTVLPINYTCSEGRADVKEREMSLHFLNRKVTSHFTNFIKHPLGEKL